MTPRQIVWRIYIGIFLAILATCVVLFASALLRDQGFPVMHWVWRVALPGVLFAVWNDPLYLLAGLIIIPFLWSIPWEQLIGGGDELDDENDFEVRRGRPLLSSSRANREAYQKLTRQIAAKQRTRSIKHE